MFEQAQLTPVRPVLVADELLDELDKLPVGPDLAAALADLPAPNAAGWNDPHTQVRVAARWAAVAAWAEGRSLDLIARGAETVASTEDPLQEINYAADLALAAQQSEGWADRQIELARDLGRRAPVMRDVVRCGGLSIGHARALLRAVASVDDGVARRIDDRLSERAVERRWTPAELAAAARRLVLRLDPDGGTKRHEAALDREADVTSGPAADGLGWLSATGDAVSISDIADAVDARARQLQQLMPGTPIGRARFAALGDLVLGQGFTLFDHVMGSTAPEDERTTVAEPASGRRNRRRELVVTVDLLTLRGLRNDPANLQGHGPIPASIARLLIADSTLRRLVTDPVTGEALHLGRAYAPSDALVTAIRATDRHCRFPGCRRVRNAQIDHRAEHAVGGDTEPANLQLLCSRHHALKTAGLWRVDRCQDGTDIWTGPDGQVVIREPDPDPPPEPPTG